MLRDIVDVGPLANHRLYIKFDDGLVGEIDLFQMVAPQGVFAPLRDEREFRQVTVNRELGTVVWPTGADLDPDVVYAVLTGQTVPSFDKSHPVSSPNKGGQE